MAFSVNLEVLAARLRDVLALQNVLKKHTLFPENRGKITEKKYRLLTVPLQCKYCIRLRQRQSTLRSKNS